MVGLGSYYYRYDPTDKKFKELQVAIEGWYRAVRGGCSYADAYYRCSAGRRALLMTVASHSDDQCQGSSAIAALASTTP
jgi:hypothetical protein